MLNNMLGLKPRIANKVSSVREESYSLGAIDSSRTLDTLFATRGFRPSILLSTDSLPLSSQ